MSVIEMRHVRRTMARVEDGRELLGLVNQATARASAQLVAEGDVAVEILAERVSDRLRYVGRTSALELLAKLGWWLIEEGDKDAGGGDE